MRMYESSTATLRAILAHPSLRRESIDQTLDALAEANTDAKEIDDAVRIGADVVRHIEFHAPCATAGDRTQFPCSTQFSTFFPQCIPQQGNWVRSPAVAHGAWNSI